MWSKIFLLSIMLPPSSTNMINESSTQTDDAELVHSCMQINSTERQTSIYEDMKQMKKKLKSCKTK